MKLLFAFVAAVLTACVAGAEASAVLHLWSPSAILNNARGAALAPVVGLIASIFTVVLGFLPVSLIVLVVGLPAHTLLVQAGRQSPIDYLLAGSFVGVGLAVCIAFLGRRHPEWTRDLEVGVVAGAIAGAWAFRMVRGEVWARGRDD